MLIPTLLSLALQAPDAQVTPPVAASPRALPAGHVHEVLHLVSITGTPLELLRLARLDLDTLRANLREGEVRVLAHDEDLVAIRALGLTATVEIHDLAAHYAQRLNASTAPGGQARSAAGAPYGQWLSPQLSQGGMGGYYTYAEIESVLDQMSAAYPNLLTPKVSIRTALQGRNIWMVKAGDNPGTDEDEPEMRIDAMHHAREPQGMQTTLYFLSYLLEEYGSDPLATYLLNEREIYLIPCVNPDGYEHNRSIAPGGGGLWRKNRRNNGGSFGVDLNRNWSVGFGGRGSSSNRRSQIYRGPHAFSEPETRALRDLITREPVVAHIDFHSFGQMVLYPWGYTKKPSPDRDRFAALGDAMASAIVGTHGERYKLMSAAELYAAGGTALDWSYEEGGAYGFTIELRPTGGSGFVLPPEQIIPTCDEGLAAVLALAERVGD